MLRPVLAAGTEALLKQRWMIAEWSVPPLKPVLIINPILYTGRNRITESNEGKDVQCADKEEEEEAETKWNLTNTRIYLQYNNN